MKSKVGWFIIAQACLLALLSVFGLMVYESGISVQDAYANSIVCERYASEIEQLQKVESVAGERSVDNMVGTPEIVALSRKCAISDANIRTIKHLTPMPIEGTDYERQDVQIDLQRVSMEQIIKLALGLQADFDSTRVTSLRLTAAGPATSLPGRNFAIETWNAQLILTQLVFVATRSNS